MILMALWTRYLQREPFIRIVDEGIVIRGPFLVHNICSGIAVNGFAAHVKITVHSAANYTPPLPLIFLLSILVFGGQSNPNTSRKASSPTLMPDMYSGSDLSNDPSDSSQPIFWDRRERFTPWRYSSIQENSNSPWGVLRFLTSHAKRSAA